MNDNTTIMLLSLVFVGFFLIVMIAVRAENMQKATPPRCGIPIFAEELCK